MLPSGAVAFEELTVDAVSEGMAIEAGQKVRVVDVRGNRVVVRPLLPDEDEVASPPGGRHFVAADRNPGVGSLPGSAGISVTAPVEWIIYKQPPCGFPQAAVASSSVAGAIASQDHRRPEGDPLRMFLLAQQNQLPQVITITVVLAMLIAVVVALAVFARYFRLWIQSVTTGAGSASSICWE